MSLLDRAEAFINKNAQQTAIYLGKKSVRSALESHKSLPPDCEINVPLRKGGIFDLNRRISTRRLMEAVIEGVSLPAEWVADLEASRESSRAVMPNGYGNVPYMGWLMSPVIALRSTAAEISIEEPAGTLIHGDFKQFEPFEIPLSEAA